MDYNKVILAGRLTKTPEVRWTNGDNSMAIAKFNVAVGRGFKKGEESVTDFISCTAFGKTAEFVEKYFDKGSGIMVEGKIQTGSYTNKEGVKVYTTEVAADKVMFTESKKSENKTSTTEEIWKNVVIEEDEDLPFAIPSR